MARKTLRHLIERSIGREWDRIVRRVRAGRKRHLLLCWNRGLGDVAELVDESPRSLRGMKVAMRQLKEDSR